MNVLFIYLFILLIWIPINISLSFSSCSPHTFNPATATHEHQTSRLFSHRKLRVSQRKKYEESALHHTTIILTNITLQVTTRPIYIPSRSPGRCTRFSPSPSACVCVSLYLSGVEITWLPARLVSHLWVTADYALGSSQLITSDLLKTPGRSTTCDAHWCEGRHLCTAERSDKGVWEQS